MSEAGFGWPDGPLQRGVAQGGSLLIPVSGVGEAGGGVREQVGGEKIGGKRQHGIIKRDMIRDEMFLRHAQHFTILSHMCSHHV